MKPIFCKKARFASLALLFLMLVGGRAGGQEPFDLAVDFEKGDLHRIKLQISHVGDVVVADFEEEDGEQKVLPLDVNAQLTYDQRYTGDPDRAQSIRYYHEASTAEIKINQQEAISDLSPTNRWIIARLRDKNQRYQVASIADVLNQTEMELIKNPADPLSLAGLFNQRNIKLRSQWSVPSRALATFSRGP